VALHQRGESIKTKTPATAATQKATSSRRARPTPTLIRTMSRWSSFQGAEPAESVVEHHQMFMAADYCDSAVKLYRTAFGIVDNLAVVEFR
jgi:hypothetical protein